MKCLVIYKNNGNRIDLGHATSSLPQRLGERTHDACTQEAELKYTVQGGETRGEVKDSTVRKSSHKIQRAGQSPNMYLHNTHTPKALCQWMF